MLEVLIATTITGIAGSLLVTIMVQNSGLYTQQTAKVSQGISLNDATTQLTEAIKSASFIAPTYPSINPVYTTDTTTTLILGVPSYDSSGKTIDNTYDYVIFVKDSSNPKIFRKRVFPNAASSRKSENRVLLTKLVSILFVYLNQADAPAGISTASKIDFTLNVSEKAGFSDVQKSSNGVASLRNS